ncbi:hypothetical protein [Leptothrix discophora]|uniref:Uncharacterized protein n=1 Tax=Leptothrix discophora TaxID=89 RepID=A0ABT9G794_LEPDI|nr:hypothetical protein [Leptothrix discophora]MDP4302295.1 hypothetical protein [Leptothrix discophora]
MDVVISLVGVLGLIAGLVLALLASWHRQRARRAVLQAETEMRISREAAARQLLELRKRLAEAESDQARIASLQDEVRRLRDKNRRLQALHALDTDRDRLGATEPTSAASGRNLGPSVGRAEAVTPKPISSFPDLPSDLDRGPDGA